MCKRTTADPLLRLFLYKYGLHLLATPRADADVGDVYISDGRRTAPAGSLRSLLEPPLELAPRRNEPMSDVAGRMTREVDVNAGLGLLEAFLGAIGASGIIQTVRAGYQRQNVRTISFAFEHPIRDHIDVLDLGAALDGRRFRPAHAIDPERFRFYLTAATARSRSLSVQARTETNAAVDLSSEVAQIVDVSSKVQIKGMADGTVTYAGEQPLTFGVELYELSHDKDTQVLRLAMPDEPLPVRGPGGARPPRAIIGDPAGDVLLAIDSTSRVTVSAEGMTSHVLLDALADVPLRLSIQPAPGKPRMLDPTVVAAAVGAEGTSLGTLIGGLVALAARHKRTKVIIQGASGARLQVRATATPEQVQASIDTARGLDVVHLHLA